ncbi:MAG: YitT family protein [Streptococcaceae bacterium]|jgi:uncharacterized membrane protein YczE|nr:YitT family protein [Streptococcaceae bacterium]MCH4178197.1 YitT family protein [Streptococcaceae bacterium]
MLNNIFCLLIKVMIAVIGIILAAFGIQLIVTANVGMDSVSTLIIGLMNFSNISFGTWSQLISLCLLLVTFFVCREKIGIASILYVVLLGGTLNITEPLMYNVVFGKFAVLFSLIGFLLYGLGIAIYLSMQLGAGPIEGLMYIMIKITKLPIRKVRMINDFLLNLIGFALGAKIGIGTLFGILCLGPLIDLFLGFRRSK